MNSTDILAALDLPLISRVDQRVPKKLLLENGAPTTADKRYINEGIEELLWLAALKPTTIGVPAYRDEVREYLEIAVLQLVLRPGANASRLVELVHRAVPYPVLLFTVQSENVNLSSAHKRWSQGEAGKVVLEDEIISIALNSEKDTTFESSFQNALSLGRQQRSNMYTLYQGWLDILVALQVARLTGKFATVSGTDYATARHTALRDCMRLDTEIKRLQVAAQKENQLSRKVELNLELKRIEAARAEVISKL